MREASTGTVHATTSRSSSAQRMVAGLRLYLAVLALAITYIDPSQPSRFQALTYAVLVGYVVISATLYAASRGLLPVADRLRDGHYWADVGFYIALIGLSGGSNSIYFVLIFFAILAAAFDDGFGAGMKVTLVSVGLFLLVSVVQGPLNAELGLNTLLIRSGALPILGYLISFFGGRQVQQVRELAFLNELGNLANPRLDIDRILAVVMERLRAFFAADTCVVITSTEPGKPPLLRRVAVSDTGGSTRAAEPAPEAIASTLLGLDPDSPGIYRGKRLFSHQPQFAVVGRPAPAAEVLAQDDQRGSAVATLLEAESFICAPLRLGPTSRGRLYIVRAKRAFAPEDAEFLSLAMEQFTPTLQQVALIDRMARQVIEDERHRIALDIHDQVIQPYIGLQLGLTGLNELLEKSGHGEPLGAARASALKLMALTTEGIAELRRYVGRLKASPSSATASTPTLARFAARYSRATGIDVELNLADEVASNDAVAETAFPIIAEALSNVHRHTLAERAVVDVAVVDGWLRIQVENPIDAGTNPEGFVPKSITERVAAIGGSVRIEPHERGVTRLIVDVPV